MSVQIGRMAEELERKMILSALEETGNNKSAAARMLGVSRKTLHEKIRRYNLGEAI